MMYETTDILTKRNIRKVHCNKGIDMIASVEFILMDDKQLISLPENVKDLRIKVDNPDNKINIDKSVKLNDVGIFIEGKNNELIVKKNSELESTYIIIRGDNNRVILGEHTLAIGGLWGDFILNCKNSHTVEIGNDCIISGGVIIRNSDGHDIIDISNNKVNKETDISIGNHVWIAEDVTILKGAGIGNNSIIGTKSVVTKKFNDNKVLAGVPAIVLKELDGTWVR